MTSSPPFAPPYFTLIDSETGQQIVETLADGSTRSVPASERTAIVVPAWSAGRAPGAAPDAPARKAPRATAGKDAALILEVPYADKDKAKKAGARWDATRKKWYVPQGTDIQLFKTWWPADMGD